MQDSLIKKLSDLKPRKTSSRLKEVMPIIESKLREGITIESILEVLKEEGIDTTINGLKSCIYRYRKANQKTENIKKEEKQKAKSDNPKVDKPPLSPRELDALMHPDPVKQSADIARYEQITRESLRNRK